MRRKRYEGPVFFAQDGWHRADDRRRKRLVVIDGHYFRAKRSDTSHQARYHRRYAQVTPS